jgi:HEPN domain-containing protein
MYLKGGKSCMRPEAGEWLKQAEYDLETAEAMWKAGRYVYTVFMCHLAIEKGLKAVIAERTGTIPPKIHNLVRLTKLAHVNFGVDKKRIHFNLEHGRDWNPVSRIPGPGYKKIFQESCFRIPE